MCLALLLTNSANNASFVWRSSLADIYKAWSKTRNVSLGALCERQATFSQKRSFPKWGLLWLKAAGGTAELPVLLTALRWKGWDLLASQALSVCQQHRRRQRSHLCRGRHRTAELWLVGLPGFLWLHTVIIHLIFPFCVDAGDMVVCFMLEKLKPLAVLSSGLLSLYPPYFMPCA